MNSNKAGLWKRNVILLGAQNRQCCWGVIHMSGHTLLKPHSSFQYTQKKTVHTISFHFREKYISKSMANPSSVFCIKKKYNHRKIQFSWINEFPDPVYLHAAQMLAPKPAVALTRTMRFWRHLVEHNSCASSTRSTLAVLRRLATSQVASLRWPIGCQSAARARPITIKDFGTNLNRE